MRRMYTAAPATYRRWSARALAGLAMAAGLVLAACVSDPAAPDASSPAPNTSTSTKPLECELAGYPCDLADVPQEVVLASMALGDGATARLGAGSSVEDVADWLGSRDGVAEVAVDGDTIRYRMDGGRPTWISAADGAIGGPTSLAPIDAVLAMYFVVAGNDDPQKRALILSPFKWERGEGDYGSRVADLMRRVKGYASGVTYLENATETATNVTVDTFTKLGGNALVHIETNSLKLCQDGREADPGTPTPLSSPCWGVIGAQEFYGTDLRAGDYVGVELYRYVNGSWSLGLSADFFNAHYSGGIGDAVIILNAPDVLDSSLVLSMQAATSEFLGWDNLRPIKAGGEVILSLLRRLAETGRTVDSVYDEMRSTMRAGDAELFRIRPTTGSQRLREIVQLRDPSSLEPLDEVGTLSVSTKLDDDEQDVVPFVVDVDGLSEEEASHATINLFFDNWQIEPILVSEGEQISDTTWRYEGKAQIGALKEGQAVEVLAYLQLPEGGLSRDPAAVTVTGTKRPDVGWSWTGTVTSTLGSWSPGVTITRTAEVEFTIDPGADADDERTYFYVTDGTLTWSIAGASDGCSYSGEMSGVPLVRSEYVYLLFNASGESITYSANANNDDGPEVEVHVQCETHDYTYRTGAEGLWWFIPPDAGFTLEGDTIAGEWSDDSEYPTTWRWELHRVDG